MMIDTTNIICPEGKKNTFSLLPCQRRWLENKVTDMTGRTYYISPCPHDQIRSAHILYASDDAIEEHIVTALLAQCTQHCPYSNDKESIDYWYNADIERSE